MEFARTPGAKDKQPRKKRNLIAEGSAIGAAGLGATSYGIKRAIPGQERKYQDLEAKRSKKDLDVLDVEEKLRKAKIDLDYAKNKAKTIGQMRDIEGMDLERRKGKLPGLPEFIKSSKRSIRELTPKLEQEQKAYKGLRDSVIKQENKIQGLKTGKKLSKYGAIGLAGVGGVELARRGIKRLTDRYEIRRKGQ